MKLPDNETHSTNSWVLREKRIVRGLGFSGQELVSHFTSYECMRCLNSYTRFVDEDEFDYLKVGESRWEWGWVK